MNKIIYHNTANLGTMAACGKIWSVTNRYDPDKVNCRDCIKIEEYCFEQGEFEQEFLTQ